MGTTASGTSGRGRLPGARTSVSTPTSQRVYLAIDLKSFFASVEARERGLDPMTTNLVVADETRTEKTICLAVSPALKTFGVPGRPRLFEVVARVRDVNRERAHRAPRRRLSGSSYYLGELAENPALAVDYLVAPPRMKLYMETSATILGRYLRWVSPADVHVYSIDEVFIDATGYLERYGLSAADFATKLIHDVYAHTGITATAGIGENLYLAKVAMDILAKHAEADQHGVRLAELNMRTYRERLWTHRPLTDFWRVGPATARKLEALGLFTMGDVARASLGERYDRLSEAALYKVFGVNAELLIDHAWGWEPTTIADIKAYRPQEKSVNVGQVLPRAYDFTEARMIVREMVDGLSLTLVEKGLTTDQIVLTVGYDVENLADPERAAAYRGETKRDHYGRLVPKPAHGSENLGRATASTRLLLEAVTRLFERIADPELSVRRMYVSANHIRREEALVPGALGASGGSGGVGAAVGATTHGSRAGSGAVGVAVDDGFMSRESETLAVGEQLDLFTDYEALAAEQAAEQAALVSERRNQEALLRIKRKFGKNAIFRGVNLSSGATALERNRTAGGHRL